MFNKLDRRVMVRAMFLDDFNMVIGLVGRKWEDGKVYDLVTSWEHVEGSAIHARIPQTEIRLMGEEGQALIDTLWECGLRPTEGKGSAGSMAATEAHLATVKEYLDRVMTLIEKPLIFARSVGKDEK